MPTCGVQFEADLIEGNADCPLEFEAYLIQRSANILIQSREAMLIQRYTPQIFKNCNPLQPKTTDRRLRQKNDIELMQANQPRGNAIQHPKHASDSEPIQFNIMIRNTIDFRADQLQRNAIYPLRNKRT